MNLAVGQSPTVGCGGLSGALPVRPVGENPTMSNGLTRQTSPSAAGYSEIRGRRDGPPIRHSLRMAILGSEAFVSVPVISVVGNSGVGKTTLLEKLVRELKSRGYRVAAIKHDAHNFQMDHPGKDTY